MVVAAATELPANPDTVPKGPLPAGSSFPWPQPALLDGPEQIGLFLVDEAGRIKRTSSSLSEGIVHIVVPTGKYLLSVEAWAPEKGLGGRIRQGITTEALPDDVATLSDLILLHSPHVGDTLPQTLASALSSMRSSTRLEATRQLALGWEVFGLGCLEGTSVAPGIGLGQDPEGSDEAVPVVPHPEWYHAQPPVPRTVWGG